MATQNDIDRLIERVTELKFELDTLKKSSEYRVGQLARRYGVIKVGRLLSSGSRGVLTIRALGERHRDAQGSEIWLLGAKNVPSEPNLPWDIFEMKGGWRWQYSDEFPYGKCAIASGPGEIQLKVGGDPEILFLSHAWSGTVEILFEGRREVIDLYSPQGRRLTVRPARTPMSGPEARETANGHPEAARPAPERRSQRHLDFLARVQRDKPRVIAVSCPRWLGVTSSTKSQFEHVVHVPHSATIDPGSLTPEQLHAEADVLVESGVKHVVFSGGDEAHFNMMQMVKQRDASIRCDLFLHSSYPQWVEPYEWGMFQCWVRAAREGKVHCIASDKFGYDRFLRSLGVRGAVLLNRAPGSMQGPPKLAGREKRVGMWISGTTYRKNPFASLAALAMVPGARLRGAGFDARAMEVVEFLGLRTDQVTHEQLSHDKLFAAMRETHLTLYVTFIECCPMLPLESLHQGVPCLVGPNSHLFEDDAYLFERLVVRFPDRAEVIADAVERAIGEREEIVKRYQEWYRGYEQRSIQAFEQYLAM